MNQLDIAEVPTETPVARPAFRNDVVVRVSPYTNPLLDMSDEDRRRLYVRVLCELVAYEGSPGQPPAGR